MSKKAKPKVTMIRKSADTTWRTPEFILERVRFFHGGQIPFDPATGPDNPTKAARFCAGPSGTLFAKESLESQNGLEVSWDWPWWINPPFSREWIQKVGREGARLPRGGGLCLLPCNRFEEPYMQETLSHVSAICWIDAKPHQPGLSGHKVAFISTKDGTPCDNNPFGSMILGFNVSQRHFGESFAVLGKCFGQVRLS